MAINKKSYEDLKPYWDYQRKVAFNKELVYALAEQFKNRVYNDFGMLSLNELKETLWTRVTPEEYEDPKPGWVPEDYKLRFEWEGDARMPRLELPKPKGRGRPVIISNRNIFDDKGI